jgi:hypothetical protein
VLFNASLLLHQGFGAGVTVELVPEVPVPGAAVFGFVGWAVSAGFPVSVSSGFFLVACAGAGVATFPVWAMTIAGAPAKATATARAVIRFRYVFISFLLVRGLVFFPYNIIKQHKNS